MNDAPNVDFKLLMNAIRSDKCVVMLGPELITTEAGQNFHEAMVETLNIDSNENIVKYYESDEFFLFNQSDDTDGKLNTYYDISAFYQSTPRSETLFRKIAQLPVSLIISLNPDQTVFDVFQRNGIGAQFSYFNKDKPLGDIKVPSKSSPLIYNLLGTIDDMETMVLTHQDLFDYLEGALNKSRLPDKLREIISSAHCYIFLGFKFEKWYLQLLLRLLKMPKAKFSISKQISNESKAFFTEQFKLKFTNLEIDSFLDMLLRECENAKPPITLRQLTEAVSDDVLKIKLLVEKNRIEEAIEALKKYKTDKESNCILLASRLSKLKEQENMGTLDAKEATLELNRIKMGIIESLKS
jgi:hypothetical protein